MFAIAQKQDHLMTKVLTFVASTIFLFVCAHTKIFLPHITPVPITMHTFAIMILGTMLPFRMALGCFIVYFIEGLVGSPFMGYAITAGPAFGYYIGMVLALFFLSKTTKMPLFARLGVSSLIITALGVFNLQLMFGMKAALSLGALPFLIGDVVKLFAAYSFLSFMAKKQKTV